MKIKLLLIAASLTLSACTTTEMLQGAPVIGKVCAAADATLVDEKAYATALTIYNPIAGTYLLAVQEGKLDAATKAKVKPLVQDLYRYVGLIKAARGSVNCDLASMRDLQSQIVAMLPKGK